MSSDHANNIKRSNRTVYKIVSQGELSLKESIGTRTNSLGKSVKGKPVGANKEISTHQAKGFKISNPDKKKIMPQFHQSVVFQRSCQILKPTLQLEFNYVNSSILEITRTIHCFHQLSCSIIDSL